MEKYDLFKTYEFEGDWWIHEDSHKLPGKLTLSPDGITLDVRGVFKEKNAWEKYSDTKQPPIIGTSSAGINITLCDAFSSGSETRYIDGLEYANYKIIANQCFIGEHIVEKNQPISAYKS